ncbi:MAG: DUF5666 domain-containing protein [Gammaproteobacteria bacterium]|nr:DUF5666 domain-containing protein [Gammaproteobacteria bacterium]
MRIRIKKSYLLGSALSALIISACSDGGGGLAGIGGSGYISSGTVTSFGSVFVNGVEFETDSSTFEIEDASGTQQGLRIGMVVQVSGSINADGITGIATHINYGDDLEGPVSNLNAGVDTTSFEVFGKTIVISAAYTAFEGVDFANISEGNVLEVSGYYDQNGELRASYVELKSQNSDASTIFEIKGLITGLSGSQFQVQGVNIDAFEANLNDLPNGLQNNQFVEVKGTFNNNIITATEVEAEDSLNEGEQVEVEGIVTRYVSNSDFDVNGQKVNASAASFSPAGLTISAGVKLEVEGTVSNGVLNATEIEFREGGAEVSATVNSIDPPNNRFTVDVLSGQLVTVQLTTTTRLEDELGDNDNLLLTELSVGNFVEVQGIESGTSTITATRVKRESEIKDIKLQGIVTAETESNFTVLGVTYPVDPGVTTYEGSSENSVSQAVFLGLTEFGETVISIQDDNDKENPADGYANEVSIED